MEQQKSQAQMSDEEFKKYQKESEKRFIIEQYSLDNMHEENELNIIDEHGNILDKNEKKIGEV